MEDRRSLKRDRFRFKMSQGIKLRGLSTDTEATVFTRLRIRDVRRVHYSRIYII